MESHDMETSYSRKKKEPPFTSSSEKYIDVRSYSRGLVEGGRETSTGLTKKYNWVEGLDLCTPGGDYTGQDG